MKLTYLIYFVVLCSPLVYAFDVKKAYQSQKDQYKASPKCGQGEKATLSTINLGMLKPWPISVPEYPDRTTTLLNQLWEYLEQNKPVSLSFQELWNIKEFSAISKLATHLGYTPIFENFEKDRIEKRGLQLLIRNDWKILKKGFFQYSQLAWFEYFGSYQRGVQYAVARSPQGHIAVFTNTHLTPLANQTAERIIQMKESLHFLESLKNEVHFISYVGDLNFSPEFEILGKRDPSSYAKNTELYPYLADTELVDTYLVSGNEDPGYSYDAKLNKTIAGGIFAGQPRQRIDFVWFAGQRPFTVNSSRLIFNTPVELMRNKLGQDVFISDHFGVETQLTLCESATEQN